MRYQVTRKLGTGGMAELFVAVAQGPDGFERRAVLKQIRADLASSPLFVKMFIDEAAISARLSHPNIVHVYEFGSARGCHFMSMELVQGRDLRWMMARLPQRKVIPIPAIAAEIVRQCCLALEYAHTLTGPDGAPLHIVHRDVTPSNIMVGCDGTVKLLDFGVARGVPEVHHSETGVGVIKGKVSYLAPEQLLGKKADHRCDLFSLGVVLHELLTWSRLFSAGGDLDTIKRVLEMPIPPPSLKWRSVPAALDRIVERALEREPDRRYQTAGEMADDLERYLGRSRNSGPVMRRLMREQFTAVWRGEEPADTFIDPNRERSTLDRASCIVGEPTVADSAATPPPLPPRRRWAFAVTASAAVMAGCMVGAWGWPSVASRPEPAPLMSVASIPTVSVSIDSSPQGASVSDDSGPIGETPLVAKMARGDERHRYLLRLDGYLPSEIQVIPDQDKPTLVQLRPARAPRPPAARAAAPKVTVPMPLFSVDPPPQCLGLQTRNEHTAIR